MKMSLHLPIDVDDQVEFQNGRAAVAMAQAVEAAGLDACFITDHPAPTTAWRTSGGHDALDPFAGLAFVAGATTRLKLHTNLVVLPYRNPFLTAKAAATLDVLSDGRLILGCGVGYLEGEYRALGVDFSARGTLMDEAIETMKAAWGDGEVVRKGRGFDAQGVLPRPRPVQSPHPPLWAGGNSERALRRAAELCDGWSPMFAGGALSERAKTDAIRNLDDLRLKIERLREHLSRTHRRRPFDICIGPRKPLQACTREEAERLVDDLCGLAELGVTWTFCNVPSPSRAAFLENIQWFGEEVVHKVHGIATPGAAPAVK
jgi:probable F420-dependent oxidoreductase